MPLRNLVRGQFRRRKGAAGLAFLIVLLPSCSPQSEATASSAETEQSDAAALTALVEKYAQSIDDVDLALAGEVWLKSDRVSFTYPRGHERGWDAIAANFYGKTMGEVFSKRDLQLRDIAVNLFGDTAVVEFNWTFAATRRKDEVEVRQSGRETQVYNRTDGGRWQLVHIHYSGTPITPTDDPAAE